MPITTFSRMWCGFWLCLGAAGCMTLNVPAETLVKELNQSEDRFSRLEDRVQALEKSVAVLEAQQTSGPAGITTK